MSSASRPSAPGGDRLEATLENRLPRPDEITSIHWHGIRLPNDQDGVPYLVQAPVRPGETFRYSFIPPDTGTFFFHTHCNTVEQLGRGPVGILVIDGDTTEPYDADQVLVIRDWRVDPAVGEFTPFFTLRGAGRAGTFGPLRAGRIAESDLKSATRLSFAFHSSDAGRLIAIPDDGAAGPLGELCRSSRTFWTINDRAWPDRDHSRLPPPLAVLQRGRSYVFALKNSSEFSHPIHIHGHTFKLIRSNKQNRPTHYTDTLLLLPEERAEVAFVADNPGDWMFHCHIIEHQETGMMGYVRVV